MSPEGSPLAYLGQLIEAVYGEGGRVYGLYVDPQRTYWFSDNNHNLIFLPQTRDLEDGDQIHIPGHVGSFVVNLRSPYRYYVM